jgi:uncharacterized protein
MKVIDMHLHLDETIDGNSKEALDFLSQEMIKEGITKGLLLHLNVQRFGFEDLGNELAHHKNIIGFININPMDKDALFQLERGIKKFNFKGLKLHPRLNQYRADDPMVKELFNKAHELGVPTLVDAFPDGNSLLLGDATTQYGNLALSCPDAPLIVAHFGGHRVIEMMLIAKRVPNIYLNFAYTLLYYRGSSVTQDLIYAIKSMRGDRIFYGSDYPDRELGKTLELTKEVFNNFNLADDLIEKVLFKNAEKFIKDFIK